MIAVPNTRAVGTSIGSRSASRLVFMVGIYSHTVAAMLVRGEPPPGLARNDSVDRRADWPDDLCEIVYVGCTRWRQAHP